MPQRMVAPDNKNLQVTTRLGYTCDAGEISAASTHAAPATPTTIRSSLSVVINSAITTNDEGLKTTIGIATERYPFGLSARAAHTLPAGPGAAAGSSLIVMINIVIRSYRPNLFAAIEI